MQILTWLRQSVRLQHMDILDEETKAKADEEEKRRVAAIWEERWNRATDRQYSVFGATLGAIIASLAIIVAPIAKGELQIKPLDRVLLTTASICTLISIYNVMQCRWQTWIDSLHSVVEIQSFRTTKIITEIEQFIF